MSRKAGSKSTIEVSVKDLFDKLAPYKDTPLKVQVGTAWAGSLQALGINLGGAATVEDDEDGGEGDEVPVVVRPKFEVEEPEKV